LAQSALPDCLQSSFPDTVGDLFSDLNDRFIYIAGTEGEKLSLLLKQLPQVLSEYSILPRFFSDCFNPKNMMDQIKRTFAVIPSTASLDFLIRLPLLECFLLHRDNFSVVQLALVIPRVCDRVSSLLESPRQDEVVKLSSKTPAVLGAPGAAREDPIAPDSYSTAWNVQLVRMMREAASVFIAVDLELLNTPPNPSIMFHLLLEGQEGSPYSLHPRLDQTDFSLLDSLQSRPLPASHSAALLADPHVQLSPRLSQASHFS
jgi:hypothetical protein